MAVELDRRGFIAAGAALSALLAAPGVLPTALAQPAIQALTPDEAMTLQLMAWHLFPIPALPPDAYAKVLQRLDAKAAADPGFAGLMRGGIASLNRAAGGRFNEAGGPRQIEAMRMVQKEPTPFFFLVRDTTNVVLFNDRRLWKMIGFEGSSVDHGGYINRGFGDIDWLPKVARGK